MTLDQMKYFLEAAKFQHIGKAAKSLSISPSAISSGVTALESELGVSLFERQGKKIRLSDQGHYLRVKLERIFDDLAATELCLKANNSSMTGTYRLGASPFLSRHLLAPAWFSLQKKHSDLVGEFSSLHTARVVSDVLAGNLDLGLCFSPFRHPDLSQYDIAHGQLKIAVRKAHPLLKDRECFKKLSDYPAAFHKPSPGVNLCVNHPIFDSYGINPKVSCLFDSDEIAIENLVSSNSWALLPDVVIEEFSGEVRELPVPKGWDAPYTISIIIRTHRESNHVLKLLKENLMKKLFSNSE